MRFKSDDSVNYQGFSFNFQVDEEDENNGAGEVPPPGKVSKQRKSRSKRFFCGVMKVFRIRSRVIYNLSESAVSGVRKLSSQYQLLSLLRTQDT